MKVVHFGVFYIYSRGLQAEAQHSPRAEPLVWRSGGEAESFEATVHLKEGPKLVKTLMQSKYCLSLIHI